MSRVFVEMSRQEYDEYIKQKNLIAELQNENDRLKECPPFYDIRQIGLYDILAHFVHRCQDNDNEFDLIACRSEKCGAYGTNFSASIHFDEGSSIDVEIKNIEL